MKKITVYTTTANCPYCVSAKQLLKSKNLSFEEITIDPDDEQAWNAMIARSRMKTVPQIYFGNDLIGGYTDLAALNQSGDLLKRLEN